jgi:tRNA1Val (adenine37-N6)-methyltransferase
MGRSTSGQPDEIGFGGLQLIQGQGFRFGIDAILLAAFAAGETGGIGIRNALRRADSNRRGVTRNLDADANCQSAWRNPDADANCRTLRGHSEARNSTELADSMGENVSMPDGYSELVGTARKQSHEFAPNICDMGCGSGIVSLILSHKIPNSTITGVEIQAEEAARAAENVARNHLTHRIRIISSDILDMKKVIWRTSEETSQDEHAEKPEASITPYEAEQKPEAPATRTEAQSSVKLAGRISKYLFDVVVTNPPYFRRGGAIPNAATGKYIARHETTATTEDFVRVASTLLPDGGDFFMVHRPDRLVDICAAMRHHHLEPKELQMVTPHPGEPANILLIHGIKGAGPELRLLPDIPVRDQDGEYTPLIHRIYERGEACF